MFTVHIHIFPSGNMTLQQVLSSPFLFFKDFFLPFFTTFLKYILLYVWHFHC